MFPLNRRDFSQAVLFLFGLRRTEYQLGLSKVFFRAGKATPYLTFNTWVDMGISTMNYHLAIIAFFLSGKRAFLETVMSRDEKLSAEDMQALLGFIHRKKWQRLIAAAKAYALIWKSIRIERLVETWRAMTRFMVIYGKGRFYFVSFPGEFSHRH